MAGTVIDNVLYLDVFLSQSSQDLDIFLEDGSQELEIELVGGSEGRLPWYLGDYVVDPRKVEQTLETKNKSMRDDVTINPIFYAETSNPSGGLTVIIGYE